MNKTQKEIARRFYLKHKERVLAENTRWANKNKKWFHDWYIKRKVEGKVYGEKIFWEHFEKVVKPKIKP